MLWLVGCFIYNIYIIYYIIYIVIIAPILKNRWGVLLRLVAMVYIL